MKILIQTGGALPSSAARAWAICMVAAASVCGTAATASAQEGQIECSVTENGTRSRGTVAIEQNGKRVASGACGRPMTVPPGKHKVTITLEGAIDNPRRVVDATVEPGKTARIAVDFDTAVLEVRIEAQGQRGTGLVAVERGGKRIGTLGSGVPARLSAGAYRVVVRLGGQEQRFDVDLRPGQRRLVRAQF